MGGGDRSARRELHVSLVTLEAGHVKCIDFESQVLILCRGRWHRQRKRRGRRWGRCLQANVLVNLARTPARLHASNSPSSSFTRAVFPTARVEIAQDALATKPLARWFRWVLVGNPAVWGISWRLVAEPLPRPLATFARFGAV